jgi:hypothetical protein
MPIILLSLISANHFSSSIFSLSVIHVVSVILFASYFLGWKGWCSSYFCFSLFSFEPIVEGAPGHRSSLEVIGQLQHVEMAPFSMVIGPEGAAKPRNIGGTITRGNICLLLNILNAPNLFILLWCCEHAAHKLFCGAFHVMVQVV